MNNDRFEPLAVNPLPEPFDTLLREIHQAVTKMKEAAKVIGVGREFSLDGRFLGDLGEVVAKTYFGIDLHSVQMEGEDATCQISGKRVEIKLRSKSDLMWVKKVPDYLVAIYLSPRTFRWGIVCNGPGELLLNNAKWEEKNKRYVTNLSKVFAAQKGLPPDAPAVQILKPA
jgi:hypothetical protein